MSCNALILTKLTKQLQLLNSIVWRSPLPHCTHVVLEVWRVWIEIDFYPYDCYWADVYYKSRACSTV